MNAAPCRTILGLLLFAAPQPCAGAVEPVPGPVPADVLRTVDGDTLAVRARIWLGQEVEVVVRWLAARTEAVRVLLHDIRHDKYGGRVVARVTTAAGSDLAAALLAAGHAAPYDGGGKARWCGGGEGR